MEERLFEFLEEMVFEVGVLEINTFELGRFRGKRFGCWSR